MRVKGRYRNQTLELDQPLALAEGTEVEIAIHLAERSRILSLRSGQSLGCSGWKQSGRILKTRSTTIGRSSMTFSVGDVVLVPFPYRDRLAERARPAVVVSADTYNQHGDVVVAAITSHVPRVAMDFALRSCFKTLIERHYGA